MTVGHSTCQARETFERDILERPVVVIVKG